MEDGFGKSKKESDLVGSNTETTAVYHFLRVTQSLDSLEVLGTMGYTTSGESSHATISPDFLSSLSSSSNSFNHLRLLHMVPSKTSTVDLSILRSLKILSLDRFLIQSFMEERLVHLPCVELFQLPFYSFIESAPSDGDLRRRRYFR